MGTDIGEIVPNFCLLSLDGPKLLAIKQNTPVQIAIRATLFQLSYFTVWLCYRHFGTILITSNKAMFFLSTQSWDLRVDLYPF